MVRIVTDSGCDLPRKVIEELRIAVVPLVVRISKKEFSDTDLSGDEYWARIKTARREGLFPQTSQPSIRAFEEVFTSLLKEGNEVICATFTSKYSGTFSNATVAARNISQERISVFDSWSASLGLGFQVLAAAELACKGAKMVHILDLLREMRAKTHLLSVLDTIEYIRMGGRANALIPMLSRALRFFNIKPIIGFVEGELKLLERARTFSAALNRIEERMVEKRPLSRLGVIHTRRPQEAKTFSEGLREHLKFPGEILVREIGAVLSSHGGPGVIGVVGVEQ